MLILKCDKITKAFGDRTLFENVSFEIHAGDRIGLVGTNGSGKSTLLKLLSGEERPDSGSIRCYTPLSFLRQQDDGVPEAGDDNLSGGEKAQLRFVMSYDDASGILLADEPTSNLDMEGTRYIEKELSDFRGSLVLVSHDRHLMNRLVNRIFELSNGQLTVYNGNYSDYVEQREARFARSEFEYQAYVKEKKRLEDRLTERRDNAGKVKKAPSRMGNSEARLHKRGFTEVQKKLRQGVTSMESRLERLEKKERPTRTEVKLSLAPPRNPVASVAVRGDALTLGFDGNKLLEDTSFIIPTGLRTALMGANGTGKTTLAERIRTGHESLRIAPGVIIGYFSQSFSLLDENKTLLQNVMEVSTKPEHEVRTVLARLLIKGEDVHKKVAVLSGGEKVKTSLARLLVSQANLIILDEPTNYLDVYSLEALEGVLQDYTGTLLLISHDYSFINNTAQRLLLLENSKITTFEGTLTEYEERSRLQEIDLTLPDYNYPDINLEDL